MKISSGFSIVNNPSVTLEPVDSEDVSQGSQVRKSSGTPYVHTLVLNALAFSVAGAPILNRKNSDGNYYTVTFPDDFDIFMPLPSTTKPCDKILSNGALPLVPQDSNKDE